MPFSLPRNAFNRLRARLHNQRVVSLSPLTTAQGRVLLSYLLFTPDIETQHTHHTNLWECYCMAQTWRALGFAVDVVSYGNGRFVPRAHYDICVDIHSNLERWTPILPPDCLKILHITGAHWIYQNGAEYARLLALQTRRGVSLVPRRIVPPSQGIECCDTASFVGNSWTRSTFDFAKKPLTRIPLSTHFRAPFPENKDWDAARRRFLWMGSTGAVLRGLDVVLEAFATLPEFQLDICGSIEAETDFFAAYERELRQLPNISLHGFVSLNGAGFAQILAQCGAIIYPSASEGGGGSVVAAMHGALVPVVPPSASVEIGDWGVQLAEISVEGVREAALQIAAWSPQQLQQRARATWEYANNTHTRDQFARHYADFAASLINSLGA